MNYPERDTLIPYTNPVMFGITHTGTIFTTLSDNTISDSSPFYEDLTIDEAVNRLEKGVGTTVFWIFWIIGTGVIVFKFYERENEWLE